LVGRTECITVEVDNHIHGAHPCGHIVPTQDESRAGCPVATEELDSGNLLSTRPQRRGVFDFKFFFEA
jgi:hypothetical protein